MTNFLSNLLNRRTKPLSILNTLDQSAENFHFPMLDNGYIYLAASKLSLFCSPEHWAIVFEVFGYSPRAYRPDLSITTISSNLYNRDPHSNYVSQEAYEAYLSNYPNTEMRHFWPISDEAWIDQDEPEFAASKGTLQLRDSTIKIPKPSDYPNCGITLSEGRPAVFELCRYLACRHREDVLATEDEQRVSIDPRMEKILSLNEWHHPDIAAGQMPSQIETFQQIAAALKERDASLFNTSERANNHWENWPEGGSL